MSDAAWLTQNENYLAAALAWLRLRLEQHASTIVAPAPATPAHPPAPVVVRAAAPSPPGAELPDDGGWWQRLWHKSAALPDSAEPASDPAEAEAAAPDSAPPPAEPASDPADRLGQAEAAMRAAAAGTPPPALLILAQRLGLAEFERNVLLLCAAVELDTRVAPLCAQVQGQAYPTFALALALFDNPAWDVLAPDRPLRFWRLIEINQPGAQPLTVSALRADERVVSFIKGLNYLDDRLHPLLMPIAPAGIGDLPDSQRAGAEAIVRCFQQAGPHRRLPAVQLLGADRSSKQLVAGAAAAAHDLHLYQLPIELLPGTAAELDGLARLWQRESMLLPLALYLDASEADATPNEGRAAPLARFLARLDGAIFLDTREPRPGLARDTLTLDIARPTSAEQRAAWAAALGPSAAENPARLAAQFNLGLPDIYRIAADARTAAIGDERAVGRHAWQRCQIDSRPRLDMLAQRIDVRATWDEIVLPPTEEALLRQIVAQVGQRAQVYGDWGFARKLNRGLGISALFAGESGTGKTMAAEVIASALQLDLYRIDLSQVVNKYIGETEKNLRRVFDAAEDGGVILFFDEADALFGKRSEVKDSHDRYANIEINYLLQRIEAFRGLAILATNMKSALDPAFLRRLRFIVNFPLPSVAERRRIWERVFPRAEPALAQPGVPLAALDYDQLARLNIAGGSILNIALNAAFMAAQAGAPVTMELILEAARGEFRKIERPINEADFRWPPAGRITAPLAGRV
ncbi:MAG: ATP-binding protein [Kouleothrix sp.]